MTPAPKEYEPVAGMGLDLTHLDELSEQEKADFRGTFQGFTGRPHAGLDFWLDTRPDILKRYRNWSDHINTRGGFTDWNPNGYGFVYLYGATGYVPGVKYLVHVEQSLGRSRAEVLEGIAVASLWLERDGVTTVENALSDYAWSDANPPSPMPDGWAPDPDAFVSGLDFSSPELSDAELASLRDWYLCVAGEVPVSVDFVGANDREALKAYRRRFESALTVMPKQVMPYVMIHISVMRGQREGIREGVLLARGMGMTKEQTVEAIAWGMFYGGVASGSIADEVAGDILEGWTGAA